MIAPLTQDAAAIARASAGEASRGVKRQGQNKGYLGRYDGKPNYCRCLAGPWFDGDGCVRCGRFLSPKQSAEGKTMSEPDLPPSDEQVEQEAMQRARADGARKRYASVAGQQARLDNEFEAGWEAHARFLAAVQPQDGEAKAEPRSELRRKAHVSGTCPICAREMAQC